MDETGTFSNYKKTSQASKNVQEKGKASELKKKKAVRRNSQVSITFSMEACFWQ